VTPPVADDLYDEYLAELRYTCRPGRSSSCESVRAVQLDKPEAFLQNPNSFVLGAYVVDAPIGLASCLQIRSPSDDQAAGPMTSKPRL